MIQTMVSVYIYIYYICTCIYIYIYPYLGEVNRTYTYPKGIGWPYFTVPSSLSGDTFKAALRANKSVQGLKYVTVTMNDDTMTLDVNVDIEYAEYLYGDGLEMAVCNNTGYVIGDNAESINTIDINTGKQLGYYDLTQYSKYYKDIGGIACV